MVEVDWDSRAKGAGWQSVIDPADSAGTKNALIDQIHWNHIAGWASRRRSVLDFGCGVGRFAQRLAQLGVDYSGLDPSPAMIESARQLHGVLPSCFFHVPALPLPFATGSFDGCISVLVLQYLRSADGARMRSTVSELARVLVPGGELLIIEQASASGGMSSSVAETSREQDYIDALSGWFDIADVQHIRCGSLSRLSSSYIRWGGSLPLRGRIEAFLAKREAFIARNADALFLQRLGYYDVAIRAVTRACG